jgi:hypothetical protein
MPVTWLCRVQAVRLKCQEPVEGQQLRFVSLGFQTGKGGAVFQQARHLFLARQANRVPAIPIKYPMTKSDAEREKEGHMTRKFLITVAIIAIALTLSIGIGNAQAHGFGGGFGRFHGGGFGGHGFYGGYGRGFYGGYGRGFYGGYGRGFYGGYRGFYPGYYGYGYSPYCYYCY